MAARATKRGRSAGRHSQALEYRRNGQNRDEALEHVEHEDQKEVAQAEQPADVGLRRMLPEPTVRISVPVVQR